MNAIAFSTPSLSSCGGLHHLALCVNDNASPNPDPELKDPGTSSAQGGSARAGRGGRGEGSKLLPAPAHMSPTLLFHRSFHSRESTLSCDRFGSVGREKRSAFRALTRLRGQVPEI